MSGVRRQADGRAQGRPFFKRHVRVRVQEVQCAAKTDDAAEDLNETDVLSAHRIKDG